MGRVVPRESCPVSSCLWGEMTVGRVVVGRVLMGRVVREASFDRAGCPETSNRDRINSSTL
jgi:hypothetical protein